MRAATPGDGDAGSDAEPNDALAPVRRVRVDPGASPKPAAGSAADAPAEPDAPSPPDASSPSASSTVLTRPSRPKDSPRNWRLLLGRYFEMMGACGLAVAQPIFAVFGSGPDVFIGGSRFTPVIFGLATVFVLPLLLAIPATLAGLLSAKAGRLVQFIILSVLVGSFVVQLLMRSGPVPLVYVLGMLTALLLGYCLTKFESLSRWLRYLAPAAVAFLALFLLASDVTPIVADSSNAGAKQVAIAKPYPIVWILFDELSLPSMLDGKGQIDATLFPNFARLSKESTWFRNYATVAPLTIAAVPAMLTGVRPTGRIGTPVASNYPDSLFTLIGGSYEMRVQESETSLCAASLCRPWDEDAASTSTAFATAARAWLRRMEPPAEKTSTESDATSDAKNSGALLGEESGDTKRVPVHDPQRFQSFIDSLTPATAARLDYIHVQVPHFQWEFQPSGRLYNDPHGRLPEGLTGYQWDTEYSADSGRLRYLMQLKYADAQLGRIIDQMKASGLWDQAILVTTADHGVSFLPKQPVRGVSEENAFESMWSIMFMRGPGLTPGTVSDQPVTQLDVLPTVADMIGVTVPWQVEGNSLLTPTKVTDPKRYVLDTPLNGVKAGANGLAAVDSAPNYAKVLKAKAQGQGDDDLHFWRFGPFAPIIGHPAKDFLLPGPPSTATITIDPPGASRSFSQSDVSVDAYVAGTSSVASGFVAIALNGTIVTVAELEKQKAGNSVYWAVLPDTRFVEGNNTVDVYFVGGSGAQPVLRQPAAS